MKTGKVNDVHRCHIILTLLQRNWPIPLFRRIKLNYKKIRKREIALPLSTAHMIVYNEKQVRYVNIIVTIRYTV
jgi:hypothetical protein